MYIYIYKYLSLALSVSLSLYSIYIYTCGYNNAINLGAGGPSFLANGNRLLLKMFNLLWLSYL